MKKFFTFIFAALLAVSCWGTVVTIGTYDANKYNINVPMVMESTSYGSLCQMLYLASEANLSDDASREITSVSFYFKGASSNITRNVEVWLMLSTSTSISGNYFLGNSSSKNAGTKVFDGQVTLPADGGWYDMAFNVAGSTSFTWTKQSTGYSPKAYNLVVTVFDKTTTKLPGKTYHYTYTATANRGRYKNGTSSSLSDIAASKAYDVQGTATTTMPLIKISFAGGDKPAAPTDVKSSNVTDNSADISWTGVDGATSYSLRYKKSGTSSYTTVNNITSTSYSLSGLEPSTTYVFGVKTVKGTESSDFTADANFTTSAELAHEHDGLTFTKWTETNSLPTVAGNYYLADNVTINVTCTIANAVNLCLNGKNIILGDKNIWVSSAGSLNIYDCQNSGKITSSNNATFGGTIKNEGILGLYGGKLENTASTSYAYCVFQNGTIKLAGSTAFVSTLANIYLNNTLITIESGLQQPSSPIKVYRSKGTFTSGWAENKSTANPTDYFISANSSLSIAKNNDGELILASGITIDETNTNNPIQYGDKANVTLIRTLVEDTYNTICLPFAVSSGDITDQFGTGTKVQELTAATLSDNNTELELKFTEVSEMEAGTPYLIKPTAVKSSYTFDNVTLTNIVATVGFDNLDFVGTFDKLTSLPIDDKNILLMGAENTLFWAQNDGGFKGLRAYFKITYNSGSPVPARLNARMTFDNVTKMQEIQNTSTRMSDVHKFVYNGQLIIIREGQMYNAQGARL